MRKHLLTAALITSLATLTVPASAGPFGGAMGGAFGGNPFKMAKLAEKLELTASQRDQIENVTAAARREARPHVDGLVALRKQLRGLRTADTFDEEAVRALAKAQSAHTEELMVIRARSGVEIRGLLTPSQREQMSELRGRRHRRHHRS